VEKAAFCLETVIHKCYKYEIIITPSGVFTASLCKSSQ